MSYNTVKQKKAREAMVYQEANREAKSTDPVNHPGHYNRGKIEVIDFINDQQLDFNLGNAVKYICRAGFKNVDTGIEDLEKVVYYIRDTIRRLAIERQSKFNNQSVQDDSWEGSTQLKGDL